MKIMKRKLGILLTATALACWAWAQDAEDKHEQVEQAQAQSQQDQTSKERAASQPDNIKITSGPTIDSQDSSATIRWLTNKKASTYLRYGTDADHLEQKQTQKGGSTNHTVTLSDLQPGTVYYFAIMTGGGKVRTQGQFQTTGETAEAQNAQQQNSSQPEQTGATQPPAPSPAQAPSAPPAPAPASALVIVKGPAVEFVTPTAAVIDWSTDARSSSIVHYGTDKNNLDQTEQAPWGSSFHRVAVQNLQPNTTYYFVVESSQAEGTGGGSKSPVAGFQTPAPGSQARYHPPVIH